MPMFRNYLWGQDGIDMPTYMAGRLDHRPPLYEIERPHGQSIIHLDVLLRVLAEAEALSHHSAYERALQHLRDFSSHRAREPAVRQAVIPDYLARWQQIQSRR